MANYKVVEGKKGTRYMKDGKFVASSTVPDSVKADLIGHIGSESVNQEVDTKEPVCLFCGQSATKQRLVSFQMVALCDEDYYDKNVGKIVGKLREVQDAESRKEAL